MNRASVGIIILGTVAMVGCGLVSARSVSSHHVPSEIFHEEYEVEPYQNHYGGGLRHHGGQYGTAGGFQRNPVSFVSSELLFEELRNRGLLGGGLRGSQVGIIGPRRRGGKQLRGPRVGELAGGRKEVLAERGSASSVGSHHSAEGHRDSLVGEGSHLDVGNRNEVHSDDEGIHKHQVVGSDKTIVKDKTFGVNDVDGFRKHTGVASTNVLSAGQNRIAAEREGGRVESGAHASHESDSLIDRQEEGFEV